MNYYRGSILAFSLLLCLLITSCVASKNNDSNTTNSAETSGLTIPDISYFKTTPTDQFLMDMDLIIDGHSFRGENALLPHKGAHLYLNNPTNEWPKGGSSPENYPPIYAVADGVVDHIDTYFKVGDNYRYGVSLTFATKEGKNVNLLYSIEPMIDPEDSNFYSPYIKVKAGDKVKKGDIIAYFYLAPSDTSNNAHIHFHMNYKSYFLAPAIFTDSVVSEFYSKFGDRGFDGQISGGTDTRVSLPKCMGYKLSATQNPFELIEVDTL